MSEDGMAQVRLRARRRLLGAVVLVLAAVVGLPLILETQPRPVAKDISIDVRRDATAGVSVDSPLAAARPLADVPDTANQPPGSAAADPSAVDTAARSPALVAPVAAPTRGAAPHIGAVRGGDPLSSGQSTVASVAIGAQPEQVAPAVRPAAPQASPAAKVHPQAGDTKFAADNKPPAPAKVSPPAPAAPVRATAPPPAAPTRLATAAPASTPKPTPAPRPDDKAPAKAAPDAKPAAPAATRFVLQVGAFEHAAAARETRGKVEKLGLKAYEQEVDAAGARRIRVRLGPYASREEAERMLQKLRAGGMSASVVPL